jgi:hypothetical protein
MTHTHTHTRTHTHTHTHTQAALKWRDVGKKGALNDDLLDAFDAACVVARKELRAADTTTSESDSDGEAAPQPVQVPRRESYADEAISDDSDDGGRDGASDDDDDDSDDDEGSGLIDSQIGSQSSPKSPATSESSALSPPSHRSSLPRTRPPSRVRRERSPHPHTTHPPTLMPSSCV